MPRELLLGPKGPARQEPVARDEPARAEEEGEDDQGAHRPRDAVECRRPRDTASPGAGEREDPEDDARPEPEGEPAPVAPKGGGNADPPPAAAREEVDGRREIREQCPDEQELDRPAADDAGAEVDVARRPGCERDPLLHRVDGSLRGPPDLAEAVHPKPGSVVAETRARPVAARRDGDRGDAAGDERRLLVSRVREREVDELPEGARPAGLGPCLGRELGPDGLDEPRRRRTGRVAGDLEPGQLRPG